jgi:Transposase zinc-ribbon domain
MASEVSVGRISLSGIAALVQLTLHIVVADPSSPEVYSPYPGTWQEFCSWFADERCCAAYLEQLRWPTGILCPKCKVAKGWQTAEGRWSCSGCGRKVSVTAGTIFDRSRISLLEWFVAAWCMTNQKHGVRW